MPVSSFFSYDIANVPVIELAAFTKKVFVVSE